jgi:hypothetical protein
LQQAHNQKQVHGVNKENASHEW